MVLRTFFFQPSVRPAGMALLGVLAATHWCALPAAAARLDPGMPANPFAPLRRLPAAPPAVVHLPKAAVAAAATPSPVESVAIAPSPHPVAPPLPFTFAGWVQGKHISAGTQVLFLHFNGEILAVRSGDLVAASYRIESITPERIVLRYLPLQSLQFLTIPQ